MSGAPHIRRNDSISKIMWTVVISLLPAAVMAVILFGIPALNVMLISILTAVFTESGIDFMIKRKQTILDGSAFLTGLLVAFNMPANVPLYVPAVASFFAIAIVKMLFGGLGYNFLNPALAGRVFVMFAWLPAMTTWVKPHPAQWFYSFFHLKPVADAVTYATPLNMIKMHGHAALIKYFGSHSALYMNLFVGNVGGSLGEVSALALLIGAAFLLIRRIITLTIPLSYIITVALFTWIFGGKSGLFTGDWLFHILSGGLILGAFFMATDMVTSPITVLGQLIFGIGAGLMTFLIRIYGGYPEGVSFSILFMNAFTPIIDRYFDSRYVFRIIMKKKMKQEG